MNVSKIKYKVFYVKTDGDFCIEAKQFPDKDRDCELAGYKGPYFARVTAVKVQKDLIFKKGLVGDRRE